MKNQNTPLKNPLSPLIWKHHFETLRSRFTNTEKRNLPPVILLTGPRGIGKNEVAHTLAKWLLCTQTGAPNSSIPFGESCGVCTQCRHAIDYVEVSAKDAEGETGTLKIDQFRTLKETLGHSGIGAGFGGTEAFRVIQITDADHMTVQAANSVLKLLEEPPKNWIFLLTASDPTLVLPTILSRCQSVRLRPLPSETVRAWLREQRVAENRVDACARVSQGCYLRALDLAQDETWERREKILSFLQDPGLEVSELLDLSSAAPSQLELLLDSLESALLDLLQWSESSAYDWKNTDGAVALDRHATRAVQVLGSREAAREFWLERSERLFKARTEMQAPINRKLLVQDLLLPFTVLV